MTGYDIKQVFVTTLSYIWDARESQIYTSLHTLEELGLVKSDIEFQRDRPNRRVYSLTAPGEADLQRWLAEPVPERFLKDEFLVKLFFSGEASPSVMLDLLTAHRDQVETMLRYCRENGEQIRKRGARRRHLLDTQLLTLDLRMAELEADLAVTTQALANLVPAAVTGDNHRAS